jgi:hypothetical protein
MKSSRGFVVAGGGGGGGVACVAVTVGGAAVGFVFTTGVVFVEGGGADDTAGGGSGIGAADVVAGGGGAADTGGGGAATAGAVDGVSPCARSFMMIVALSARTTTMPRLPSTGTRRLGFFGGSARASECCEAKVSLSTVAAVGGRGICGLLGRMTT